MAVDPVAGLVVGDVAAWSDLGIEIAGRSVGLDRAVRWALPTDLPDPSPYLRGDELLLVSGVLLAGDEHRAFVRAVLASRPAAIGYALGVVRDDAPPELVAAANAEGLCVLTVPPTTPFVALSERVASTIAALHEVEREHERVGFLMDAVQQGLASPLVLRERLLGLAPGRDEFTVVATRDRSVPAEAHALVGRLDDVTIAVLPSRVGARDAFADVPHGWTDGIRLRDLARGIREARAALGIAARRDGAAGPRDLATWDGLVERLTPEQLGPFRHHVLAPLREHDVRHHGELVATAAALCAHDGRVSAVAAALFAHENTIRKRIARIEALTGVRASEAHGRATLALALAAEGER